MGDIVMLNMAAVVSAYSSKSQSSFSLYSLECTLAQFRTQLLSNCWFEMCN